MQLLFNAHVVGHGVPDVRVLLIGLHHVRTDDGWIPIKASWLQNRKRILKHAQLASWKLKKTEAAVI
jgi:hypothetical protein